MEFALKHIFARDILPWLKDIAQILHQLDNSGGRDFIETVLHYLLIRGELSDKNAFFNLIDTQISHEVGEKIMSLAEQLKAEGRIEGRVEGKMEGKMEGLMEGLKKGQIEIAKKMLDENSDPVFVLKVTGLSLDEINMLQKH